MRWPSSCFLRRIYGRADEGGFQILHHLPPSFSSWTTLVKLVWGTEYKSLAKPEILARAR